MQISKWTKPGTEENLYYFDLRFGGCKYLSRSENAALVGRWIGSDDAGNAVSFQKPQIGGGMCRGEEGEYLDRRIGFAGMKFEDFERIMQEAKTPRGNFSEARFFQLLEKPGH